MEKFVVSQAFKKLNIGLVLDEGLASADEVIPVYYGERNVYWVKFHCGGNPGHGSRFVEGAPGEKVQYLINKVLGFRSEQKKIFESDSKMTLGDVTTVNLTMMQGGVQVCLVIRSRSYLEYLSALFLDERCAERADDWVRHAHHAQDGHQEV